MARHYQAIPSSHPSMGSPATDDAPRCCARCRRGTPATGLGPCGYGDQGCPNMKCGCHKTIGRFEDLLEASSLGTPEAAAARATITDERAHRIVALAKALPASTPSKD